MKHPPAKTVLWTNLCALMEYHWHEINLNRLSREAKIGVGSAARIKAEENSTGLDILQKIAGCFGVQPWHLLLPDFDPARPTALPSDPGRRKWLGHYDRLNDRQRQKILDMAEEFKTVEEREKEVGNHA